MGVIMGQPTVSGDGAGPSLVLISGCTGTGKSTFGMEVAISQGILKCISTDTIRQVQRGYDTRPAVHRSSFEGDGDPVQNWLECCEVLQKGIDGIVLDSLRRGVSLVLEGVHIVPDRKLIDQWTAGGGVAVGCVLTIPDREIHKEVIFRRGVKTTKGAEAQLNKLNRIRAIHDEMSRRGTQVGWLNIEQKPQLAPKPLEILTERLKATWVEGASQRMLNSIYR